MEEFIQKYLNCRNLENYEDLIDGFPIIYVKLNNQMKRLLIYRFVNNKMPNYIVIGKYDENFIFDKDQFSEWLKSLNFLIHYNLKEGFTEEYLRQEFNNYFDKISKNYGTDIDCFSSKALPLFTTQKEWEAYNWSEKFKSAIFYTNIKVNVTSSQMITKT